MQSGIHVYNAMQTSLNGIFGISTTHIQTHTQMRLVRIIVESETN